MTDPSARDALLDLAAKFEAHKGPERDDATVVWEMAERMTLQAAAALPHGQLEGETASPDGGEAGGGSVALGDAQAQIATLRKRLELYWSQLDEEAMQRISGWPKMREAITPVIRAAERERIVRFVEEDLGEEFGDAPSIARMIREQ